ncbi:MAG: hypothetical protein IPI69_11990 [Bacteroidales bacterium]|nr:hypothetical protein [Bacteroidales bacterium]
MKQQVLQRRSGRKPGLRPTGLSGKRNLKVLLLSLLLRRQPILSSKKPTGGLIN